MPGYSKISCLIINSYNSAKILLLVSYLHTSNLSNKLDFETKKSN